MQVYYPVTTKLLIEARLYAQDSIQHTMDYHGWKDQHEKKDRITYGKFGQLWVTEFCRLNKIPYDKDRSSPLIADDVDVVIREKKIDVKTTVHNDFVGQVSPGVINKECDDYCFLVTDKGCSFLSPIGFVSRSDYLQYAICVHEGEVIPGTNIRQRFGSSYFLPPHSPCLIPFVRYLMGDKKDFEEKMQPFPTILIEASEMEDCIKRLGVIERSLLETQNLILEQRQVLIQMNKNLQAPQKKGKVVSISGGLFGDYH